MLPSNHLLKNGRYSIERPICAGHAGTIYLAADSLRNARVAIIERSDRSPGSDSLARTQHEGLVRITDDFQDKSCQYSATEPILMSGVRRPEEPSSCQKIFNGLGTILLALNAERVESDSSSSIDLTPEMFMWTADGKLKLLYPGSNGFSTDGTAVTSPYAPLESIWESLDHITQKAIYNNYDETSLALLESPVDARSDLYSLGAVFYKLLAGKEPIPAVERAIEMLESNADPLRSASSLNPAVNPEQSNFIERMLEIKRERRFGSLEDALFSLPTPPAVAKSKPLVPEPEDFPLLELPATPVVINAPVLQKGLSAKPDVHLLETTPLDTASAFEPPFTATEKVTEPTPAPTPVPAEPVQNALREVESKQEPRPEPKEVFSAFEPIQPEGSGAMKYVAIAAGALIVAAGIGWAVLSGPTATKADPAASMAAPQTVVQEQKSTVPSEPAPTMSTEPASATTDTGDNADVSKPVKPKPQIADTRAAPPKSAKLPVKSEPKPSKKLTVEDLIN